MNDKEYKRQWYIKNADRIKAKQAKQRRQVGIPQKQLFSWSEKEEIQIVDRLLTTEATIRSIALEEGCSPSTIKKLYHRYTSKDQRLEAKHRKQSASLQGRKWGNGRQPRNPQEVKARSAVNNAVRDGRLHRPNYCQQKSCSAHGRIEAHHWRGYDDDHLLDVIWLCASCHRQSHLGVLEFELVEAT